MTDRGRAEARFNGGEPFKIAIAPPHWGQSHSGRGASVGVESAMVCETPVCPRRAKHNGNNAARRRWAKNPKWRMRTKPGEHMQQEPAQEFIHRQRHQPLLILMRGIAPAESDMPSASATRR